MRCLVTGGAGYIGSHVVRELLNNKHDVIVLDSLVKGRNFTIERNKALADKLGRDFAFVKGDLADKEILRDIFKKNKIDAVLHFAAFIEVKESMEFPALYFHNNVINTINLLDAMAEARVKKIIFSSSAAVYGNAKEIPLSENSPKNPTNPYGYTKLAMEKIIEDYSRNHNIQWIAFRYFNAAGASKDSVLGEAHFPESHLIPLTISKLLKGEEVSIFGTDYKTKDGTCIRDYIHVDDLAKAHVIALDLNDKDYDRSYNLGTGGGFSVREIAETTAELLKVPSKWKDAGRRAGDPDILVASSDMFKKVGNWSLTESDIKNIISSAINWYKNTPEEAKEQKYLPEHNKEDIYNKVKDNLLSNNIISADLKDEIINKLDSYIR